MSADLPDVPAGDASERQITVVVNWQPGGASDHEVAKVIEQASGRIMDELLVLGALDPGVGATIDRADTNWLSWKYSDDRRDALSSQLAAPSPREEEG